jgi:hypothetical protein
METASVPCLLCDRPLDAGDVPGLLTVVAGETRGLCAACAGRGDVPPALAAALGLPAAAVRALLLIGTGAAAPAAPRDAAD